MLLYGEILELVSFANILKSES